MHYKHTLIGNNPEQVPSTRLNQRYGFGTPIVVYNTDNETLNETMFGGFKAPRTIIETSRTSKDKVIKHVASL